jgi:hypothetical protein
MVGTLPNFVPLLYFIQEEILFYKTYWVSDFLLLSHFKRNRKNNTVARLLPTVELSKERYNYIF